MKTTTISIRVTEVEKQRLKNEAEADNRTVSNYISQKLHHDTGVVDVETALDYLMMSFDIDGSKEYMVRLDIIKLLKEFAS
jgi:hypothetical protein